METIYLSEYEMNKLKWQGEVSILNNNGEEIILKVEN